jgi:fibronectin type 3 domain-containing protein
MKARHGFLKFILPLLLIGLAGCSFLQTMGIVAPDTPTGLVVGNEKATTLDISWDTANGAKSYKLSRATSQNGVSTAVANTANNGYQDTGLEPGTSYWYKVVATNPAGDSPASAAVKGMTTGGAAAAVAAPTFSPGTTTSATALTVTISTTTSGASIRYTTNGTIPTSTSGILYDTLSAGLTISTSTVVNAIAYKTGLTDSTVASATYTIGSTTLPVAAPTFSPSGGSYVGTQTVTISSTTSGAEIYYTTNGSTPSKTSTLYAGQVSVATSMLINAIAYKAGMTDSTVSSAAYNISASAGITNAQASAAVKTFMNALIVVFNNSYYWVPTGTDMSWSTTGINFTQSGGQAGPWVMTVTLSQFTDTTTGYTISGTFTLNGGQTGGTLAASNLTLTGGPVTSEVWNLTYSSGASGLVWTGTVKCNSDTFDAITLSFVPAPSNPYNLQVSNPKSNSLDVSWSGGISLGSTAIFELYRDPQMNGTFTNKVYEGSSSSFIDNIGLSANTPYYYKVRAYNTTGTTKNYSLYSYVGYGMTAGLAPATPTGVGVSPSGTSSMYIYWNYQYDAANYAVERSTTSTFSPPTTQVYYGAGTYYYDSGVVAGQDYYYRVKAVNSSNISSGWSTPAYGRLDAPPPATPTGLMVDMPTTNSLFVHWNYQADAMSYEVLRDTSPNFNYNPITQYPGNVTSFTDSYNLTPDTPYYYQVRAVNAQGIYSSWSMSAGGRTNSSMITLSGNIALPAYLTYWDEYYSNQNGYGVYPGYATYYGDYYSIYVMVLPGTSLTSNYPNGAYTWDAASWTSVSAYYYPYYDYSTYYSFTFTPVPGQSYIVVAVMAPIWSWNPSYGNYYQYNDSVYGGYGNGYAAMSSGWTLVPTATAPVYSGTAQTINLTLQSETY